MDSRFWSGKRVLITGHTGFKGSWLAFWLKTMGADVMGYALPPPTTPSLFELIKLADGMKSIIADVRDSARISAAVADFRPEIVFHLAAQALVGESYSHPLETYSTNVMGTANILEAVRHTPGVKAVVNVTTDKCYENREQRRGYSEDDRLGGYDPYSSSKACSELVTAAYRNSFFCVPGDSSQQVAVASARAGNVIGGGDWALDRLIPDIMRGFLAGSRVTIRNPDAVRPWQHVLEPTSGYLLLAEKLYVEGDTFAEAWNFGPDAAEHRPVRWIVERIAQAWGRESAWTIDAGSHLHETTYLALDSSKAKEKLCWRPRWSLQQALEAVTEWYSAYGQGKEVSQIMLRQIAQYQGT